MEQKHRGITIAAAIVCAVLLILGAWEDGQSKAHVNGNGSLSAATRSRLAAVALEEYNRSENQPGCGELYWGHWGKTAEPWCVDFLYYCGDRLGLVGDTGAFGPYVADCPTAWAQLAEHGAILYALGELEPEPGDIVFWYKSEDGPPEDVSEPPNLCHAGIVLSYAEGQLSTIEGNAGGDSYRETKVVQNTYGDLTGQAWEGVCLWGFARLTAGAGDLTEMVKQFEGFSRYPYWDYAQYSIGYGTVCPVDKLPEYTEHGISEEEALALLEQELTEAGTYVDRWLTEQQFPLNATQRDALVSLTYNIGPGWMTDSGYANFRAALMSADTTELELVQAFARISRAGGEVLYGLVERRICEAHLFLHGEYLTDYHLSGYTYTVSNNVVTVEQEGTP